jgi:hypothetical protein
MPGSDSFAACWFVTNICSPSTMPSFTSHASGLRSGGIFETRSSNSPRVPTMANSPSASACQEVRAIGIVSCPFSTTSTPNCPLGSCHKPPSVSQIKANSRSPPISHSILHPNWSTIMRMESYTNARNAPASVVAKSKALTDADYFSKFGKCPEICQITLHGRMSWCNGVIHYRSGELTSSVGIPDLLR